MEDIILSAKIGSLNSEQAQQDLIKKLNKTLSNATLDKQTFSKQLSDLAKEFGTQISIQIQNALTQKISRLNFGKKSGGELEQILGSPVKSHTVSLTPGKGNSNQGLTMTTTTSLEREIAAQLQKLGANVATINKIIDQGLAKALSGVGFDRNTGRWYGSLNFPEGVSQSVSGAGKLVGNSIVVEDYNLGNIEQSMTAAGQPYAQKSAQAENLLKIEKQIKQEYETQLARLEKMGKPLSEQLAIKTKIEESDAKIKQLEQDTQSVFEKGTQAQQKRQQYVNDIKHSKQQLKEIEKENNKLEKEQNTSFTEAKNIQKEMNSLIRQNIEYRGKANEEVVVAENEKKLAVLEKEYELKKELLTEDQKAVLKQQEGTNQLSQQLLLQEKIYKLRSTRNTKGTFMDEVETALGRVTTYGVAYNLINKFKNGIKETLTIITKFDKAMTNLAIVTQKDNSEVKKLAQSYVSLAQELGTTTDKVFEAADLWLRQGRSIAETNELIKATMIMANVAQIDSAKSADILTSAINGFKLEAKDAMHIVDVFAAVDLAAAANTEELAEAMQRVAATAGEVGVSFENITSYIATLVDATRLDSGTIGSAKCFWCGI